MASGGRPEVRKMFVLPPAKTGKDSEDKAPHGGSLFWSKTGDILTATHNVGDE
jgi:hypothetical protein